MRIRTDEKWCWSHKICALLRMQLDLNYIKLIDKTVVNLLVFTARNWKLACRVSFNIKKWVTSVAWVSRRDKKTHSRLIELSVYIVKI
jgi:hypothetical protein